MNPLTIVCIVVVCCSMLYSTIMLIYGLVKKHKAKRKAKQEVLNDNDKA